MKIQAQVELASRTTLRVGGKAAYYARVESEEQMLEALAWAHETRVEVRVLGGGSNIVVADAGFAGLVIDMAMTGLQVVEDAHGGVSVTAAAGEPWDELVRDMVAREYQGLECLSGIPGRVGATPIQNVGAYGQDVSETISRVHAVDRLTGAARSLSAAECAFAYRDSFFKSAEPNRFIVTAVTFRLRVGGAPAVRYPELVQALSGGSSENGERCSLRAVREAVLRLRRSKSMVLDVNDPNSRSCGSFFTNPMLSADAFEAFVARAANEGQIPQFPQGKGIVKLSAGWLIEHAGFPRGTRAGCVGSSTHHALALVAHDGASAADVAAFAEHVQRAVYDRFGVALTPEPVFWGF